MRWRIPLVCALVCIVALSGCTARAPSDQRLSAEAGSMVGTWTLPGEFDTPETPFVSFSQNKSWIASDGCTRVYGSWTLSPSRRLTVTVGTHEPLTCAGNAATTAMTGRSQVAIEPNILIIRSAGEDTTVTTLERTTDSSVGPRGRPIGYWVAEQDALSPYLSVRADRTYRAFDGCFTTTGTWIFSNTEELRLTPDGGAPATCRGVDQWLRAAAYARVTGEVMTVTNSSGERIGELTSH